jgi:hypothetical protein
MTRAKYATRLYRTSSRLPCFPGYQFGIGYPGDGIVLAEVIELI